MLREVAETDLPFFYEHQRDPKACMMAAYPPRELRVFLEHWHTKILGDPSVRARTIITEGYVAGYVSSWHREGVRLLGYWLGREFWGQGIASAALAEFVGSIELTRPIDALAATSNPGSIRVLQKCGFQLVPGSLGTGADGIEEIRLRRIS